MKTFSLGTIVFLASSFLLADKTWQQWKEADKTYQKDLPIVVNQGAVEASKLRAQAQDLELQRLTKLADKGVIAKNEWQRAVRDYKFAKIEARDFATKLEMSKDEKALDAQLASCQSGTDKSCTDVSATYGRIFKARRTLALSQAERSRAALDYETFLKDGIQSLVEKGMLDAGVLDEAKLRVEARQIDERTANEQAALIKE